jgi:hypothetical protein
MTRTIMSLLLALVFASASSALMLVEPIESIAESAEIVLEGTVKERHSFWNDSGTTILTDVLIESSAVWKGDVPSGGYVVVRVEGGEVGDVGIWVEHQPRFSDKEQVLLFLDANSDDRFRTVHQFEQGKFRVIDGEAIDFRGHKYAASALRSEVNKFKSQ